MKHPYNWIQPRPLICYFLLYRLSILIIRNGHDHHGYALFLYIKHHILSDISTTTEVSSGKLWTIYADVAVVELQTHAAAATLVNKQDYFRWWGLKGWHRDWWSLWRAGPCHPQGGSRQDISIQNNLPLTQATPPRASVLLLERATDNTKPMLGWYWSCVIDIIKSHFSLICTCIYKRGLGW